jgi:hypothetical protein
MQRASITTALFSSAARRGCPARRRSSPKSRRVITMGGLRSNGRRLATRRAVVVAGKCRETRIVSALFGGRLVRSSERNCLRTYRSMASARMRTFSTAKPYSRNRTSPGADARNRSQDVEQRRVWFDVYLLAISVISDAEVLHRTSPSTAVASLAGLRDSWTGPLSSIWARTTIRNCRYISQTFFMAHRFFGRIPTQYR